MRTIRITNLLTHEDRVETINGKVDAEQWLRDEQKRLIAKGWKVEFVVMPNGRMFLRREG